MEEQRRQVRHTKDFAKEAADWIESSILEAMDRGRALVSLCGGGTPRPVYELLAKRTLPWERIFWTFGDERTVPPDHAESNYRMAKLALFDPAGIPPENVFRIEGELAPHEAALKYEMRLHELKEEGEPILRHDVVLLGVGGDGHTASLFPGTLALDEPSRWVVQNRVPQLDTWRLTLTYPLINAARKILFLVNDAAKRTVIDEIFAGVGDHPAGRVRPVNGTVSWMLGYEPAKA